MDEIRYLLRGLVRRLRWHCRQASSRRRAITSFLSFAVGVVLWLGLRRWLPPPMREGLRYLGLGLLALLKVWLGVRYGGQLFQLYQWARGLQPHTCDDLLLTYDAALEPQRDALCQLARRSLREAEQFLQTPLEDSPKRVFVLTEASLAQVNRILPRRFPRRGWADIHWESIHVVHYGDLETTYRTMRHEWAHVITGRWNENAPALFREGIAVATQHHDNPLRAHAEALYYLHYFPNCSLISLLPWDRFYNTEMLDANYAWAGSFVLYLIEQFGLSRFRRFYYRVADQSVEDAFCAEFEMSFGQAELLWRDYLHTELPEETRCAALRRALRDSVRWAVAELSPVVIETLGEQLRRLRPEDWLGYYARSFCAFWQGDLSAALEAFEQANAAAEQEETDLRGRAWFECGLVCDLLGQRARAIECYQTALRYPDFDAPQHAYHARARQYIETPYTYAERVRFLSR